MPTLNFKGKSIIQNHHLTVKYHQLYPREDLSLSGNISLNDNLIIHGDNLKALKALLPNYAGKIKCIYADPPYNTGNEKWVFNDNVNSPMMQEWFGEVVDKEDLTRHDKWLCMMMPRLKLLKELLRKDGIIFISIDNNEVHNLRLLMDEIFGEGNFISCVANVNNPKGRSDDKYIPTAHEYLLIYKKEEDPELFGWKPEDKVLRRYRKKDEESGLRYREIDLRKTGDNDRRIDRENLFYYFYYNEKNDHLFASKERQNLSDYVEILPLREDGTEGNWRWECEYANKNINYLVAKIMPRRGIWTVYEKDFLTPDKKIKPTSAWTKKDFNSERGTEQFINLGFKKEDFDRPKPVGLIKHIIEFATYKDDIILDSFAGSGTTAQATMELNNEDGGNRQFILVECEDYANEITAERVRRVINGVPGAEDEELQQGYGGSFSYFELGEPIEIEKILKGENLPDFENMARYIFYTATGEEFDASRINYETGFIGESNKYKVYLLYKPDMEYLKSTALNLDFAKQIYNKSNDKKNLVFAPMRFLDDKHLKEYNIDFCQLPYEIYRYRG